MVSSPALDVFQQVTERGWYELPTHGPEASSWSLCSNPHMWKRGDSSPGETNTDEA